MNKLKNLLTLAFLLLMLVGCKKEAVIKFTTASVTIAAEGGETQAVLTSNGEWTVDSHPEWLTVSPMYGSGDTPLTLFVYPNQGEERSGQIKVATKDHTATLNVTQAAFAPYIRLVPNEIQCPRIGGVFQVEIQSNIEWNLSQPPTWISSNVLSGTNNEVITLTIAAIEGDINESREATLIVAGDNMLIPLKIFQTTELGYTFNVNPINLEMDYVGGTATLSITSDVNWSATTEADWIGLSPASGNANAEVTVTVAENESLESREAYIQFTNAVPGGTTHTTNVMVRQEAAPDPHFLEVSPEEITFAGEGGSAQITVECDTDWTAISIDEVWVTIVSGESGNGNGTIVIQASPNPSFLERNSEVVVKSGELKKEVIIHQEGNGIPPEITLLPDTLYFSPEGSVENITVNANVSWVLNSPNWVLLPQSSGTGNALVGAIVEKNPTSERREGLILGTNGGITLGQLVVIQEGRVPYLEVDNTELTFGPQGGEVTVNVSSNQSWIVSKGANWLHYTPDSGYYNGQIQITVDPMMTHSREADIYVVGGEEGLVIIKVIQRN